MDDIIHKISVQNKDGVELLTTGTTIGGMIETGLALLLLAHTQANCKDKLAIVDTIQRFAEDDDSPLLSLGEED